MDQGHIVVQVFRARYTLAMSASRAFSFAAAAAVLVGAGAGARGAARLFSSAQFAPPPGFQEALWWKPSCRGVQCGLCPFHCFLPEGIKGRCRARMNVGGRLVSLVYGRPVAVHVDPIEKKPVFHLLPGSGIYSLATAGCNLSCLFCQNWEISQINPEQASEGAVVPRAVQGQYLVQDQTRLLSPDEIVEAARRTGCRSVAYTYSEPIVAFEYVLDTARKARAAGLKNVLVSAGYIEPGPLDQLAPWFDVVKIDLKGFDRNFYRRYVGGDRDAVLRTLLELKRLGVMTEVVNLVVPTLNDRDEDFTALARWTRSNLGPDTPLFFSRFTPQYRLDNLPPTPVDTLGRAWKIARAEGLRYVYLGNVPGHPAESTYCPTCGRVLVRRRGFAVLEMVITRDGKCPYCGTKIPGVWS